MLYNLLATRGHDINHQTQHSMHYSWVVLLKKILALIPVFDNGFYYITASLIPVFFFLNRVFLNECLLLLILEFSMLFVISSFLESSTNCSVSATLTFRLILWPIKTTPCTTYTLDPSKTCLVTRSGHDFLQIEFKVQCVTSS